MFLCVYLIVFNFIFSWRSSLDECKNAPGYYMSSQASTWLLFYILTQSYILSTTDLFLLIILWGEGPIPLGQIFHHTGFLWYTVLFKFRQCVIYHILDSTSFPSTFSLCLMGIIAADDRNLLVHLGCWLSNIS